MGFRRCIIFLLSAAVVAGLIILITSVPKTVLLSPEMRKFIACYESVQEEMTETQIDAIFASYKSSKWMEETDRTGFSGPLKRPSTWTKVYNLRAMVVEGDFFVA